MTGITPLQSFHKRGLFGNHHKKNESDLLKITGVKDLMIVQIVQYKRSKVEINEINIDEIKFPKEALKVNSNEKTRILWSGPKTWIVVSEKENIFEIINKKCNSQNFAVTDISQSRAVIKIKGHQSKEILKKGCPINFNEFKKNNCAGTTFHGINILVDKIDEDPETFNLFALRSFAESFYHSITDAAMEDGYVAI